MNENHLIDFFEENVASMESRGSLASQAYSQLLYWIVSLKFRPGEHLQERFLGEQLKMSRTPIREALRRLEQGSVEATKQDEALVSYAPMLDKSICPIDWNKSAQAIHNQVRGLHPWPVATMELQGSKFKVHETRIVEGSHNKTPGEVIALTKTGLQMACGEGIIEIRTLQAEGGKRMAAPDYFRGHPLEL
jgi:methionyl-tRNA formyltransferase